MSNIEWLIKYERESTKLDFKREQYQKEKFQDLIKDIMSMANAPVEGKKYIIVGVKEKPDNTKEYFSINKDEFVDQATYQQIIRENVEPIIDFSYYPIEFDGILFGIFEIERCDNPPYMMKKDYKGILKKGECYVRRGTQQERMTRRDLDDILSFKSKYQFNGKILVGFNKKLDKKLTVNAVKEFTLPSTEAKEKIETILEERKINAKFGLSNVELLGLKMNFGYPFNSLPYEERTTETLKENLEKVEETYYEHDMYYIGEELSEKINLTLRNDGEGYVEDVSIQIKIPKTEGIWVMDEIPREPVSKNDFLGPVYMHNNFQYPSVKDEERLYIIEENIGNLKHHQYQEAFNENLRIFFNPNSINKTFTWTYTIFAKNLPSPITGELTVEVV
ncbi:ATP-binding protein [Neobacillus drentensis]|uniref:ATP-binding protein n=1 Tax=Neobacillus drentensis TaxID=220684 RepID=UPI002FFF2FE2